MGTVMIPQKSGGQISPPPPVYDTDPAATKSWTDFTQNTSFHGVKYIFEDSGQRFRRQIWLLVVFAALSAFVIQVGIRTGNYLEYKTTLDMGKFYTDRLDFPAITICNQNRHRISAVGERGLYDVLDEVFKRATISEIPWEKFGDRVHGIDYGVFTLQTGHQKRVFIDRCTWNGVDCDIDNDFKEVFTDLGLCYTFNGQQNVDIVSTPKAGAGSGLKLMINVEQYEYMRGPQDDAGIKILLHPRDETPIMQEHGFAAAPGAHTLVGMRRSEVTTLQPPYGNCHPTSSPVSECQAECHAHDIINTCGCRTENMQHIIKNGTIACDFKTSLSCVRQTLDDIMKSESKCDCRPPCKQVHYEPQLSYAQLSKFNIDRTILDNPDKRKRLEESYLKVRECTQRYIEEIRSKDEADMTKLVTMADRLQHSLQNVCEKIKDSLTTSRYYNLPAIIVPQHVQIDLDTINDIFTKLKYPIRALWNGFIRYMVLDIDSMKEEFMEWDGSVFKFPHFLSDCLEEATAAQQNNSSGDVDLDLLNNSLLYVSPKCKTHIESKTQLVDWIFDSPNFKNVESDYQNIVASIFKNSTKSLDAFDDHKACLRALGLASKIFPEFYNDLRIFIRAETLEDYILITNKIIIKVKVFIGAYDNLEKCFWVGDTLDKMMTDVIMLDATLHSNGILMDSFDIMSKTVISMALDFELINPIIEMITAYVNETGTKMELARQMQSSLTTKVIEEMGGFVYNGYIVIKSLQEKLTSFKNRLAAMYVTIGESPLPLLNMDEFQNLEFFKLAYETNRTEFQHLIDGLSSDNMTNVQQLLDLVFSEYQLSLQGDLEAIFGAFTEISDHLDMLRGDLQVYAKSTVLNADFFMENFLQLDIFYKDMSYEVMTHQEAFGLVSLMSEIGGFLGLLLGASLITVCELLDYLLLNVAKCCKGRRKEDPKVVPVESAEKYLIDISTL